MLWKLPITSGVQLPGVQFESFLLNQYKIHLYVHRLDPIYLNLLFSSFCRGESSSYYPSYFEILITLIRHFQHIR